MRRHPLLWKLAVLQVGFCLLLVWLIWTWGLSVERSTYFLSPADQDYLARYAQQAEDAWNQGGAVGIETWRRQLEHAENTWVAVIGPHLQSLGTTPLSAEQASHLTFMRKLDWPMSRRLQDELPYVSIEFPRHPEHGRLVLQLPERLLPTGLTPWTHVVTHGVAPALLALLLGLALYRHLVVPLNRLRDRADALRADDLDSPALPLQERRDELGELAQASSTWPGACARAWSSSACCCARCRTNCARRWHDCVSPMTAACRHISCASVWTAKSPTCRSCWKTPWTWPGWTPSNPACRPNRY